MTNRQQNSWINCLFIIEVPILGLKQNKYFESDAGWPNKNRGPSSRDARDSRGRGQSTCATLKNKLQSNC